MRQESHNKGRHRDDGIPAARCLAFCHTQRPRCFFASLLVFKHAGFDFREGDTHEPTGDMQSADVTILDSLGSLGTPTE